VRIDTDEFGLSAGVQSRLDSCPQKNERTILMSIRACVIDTPRKGGVLGHVTFLNFGK